MIWKGTEAALWAYQGGDGTDPASVAPTDFTGAMWQVDTDFEFRFPLGIGHSNIGTNPVPYAPASNTVVAQGATGGAEKIVITPVDHTHLVGRMRGDSGATGDDVDFLTGATSIDLTSVTARVIRCDHDAAVTENISTVSGEYLVTKQQEKVGGGVPDNITQAQMPPYKAVVFARRTARKYLTVIV
jgi:hypothetical protein